MSDKVISNIKDPIAFLAEMSLFVSEMEEEEFLRGDCE
jgi:hypothetical protein